mgnify:CR=1 FL=1
MYNREWFSLPDKKTTQDPNEYVNAWGDFIQGVERILGGKCIAFDPGVLLELGPNHTLSLDPVVVSRLRKVFYAVKELLDALPEDTSDLKVLSAAHNLRRTLKIMEIQDE